MRSSRENERSFGKKRLNVFVDANTIISGVAFEGNEALLLKLGATGACRLATTRYVINEVTKVLQADEFRLSQEEITATLSFVYRSIVVHEDVKQGELRKYFARLDDKKDVHVLAAFEKLKCDVLVTGDKELLRKVTEAKTTRQALEMILGKC
jgi:predicted nucleic acid-binding protein